LQTSNQTVLGAINELNSKVFIKTQNLSTFSINISLIRTPIHRLSCTEQLHKIMDLCTLSLLMLHRQNGQ
jgi:hypothetical protein